MGMHSTYTATHYKDLNIDWQARAVTRHGEDILLTPQEVALLQAAATCCIPPGVTPASALPARWMYISSICAANWG